MAKRGRKKKVESPSLAPARRTHADDYKLLLRAALIIILGIWIYSPALTGEWLWDDRELVADNVLMHDPDGLYKIWFQPTVMFDFLPLKISVEWIEWRLFGEDTTGYHIVSLALHFLSAFLFWRLLAKFGLRHAWLGGLIFVVHPIMVESVAWIAELKNTLSLPFFLLAMCAWIDFDARGRRKDYVAALVLFLLAMLSKPSMVMFPLVLLLYAWWKRGRVTTKDISSSAPFFAVSLAVGLATLWFLHRTAGEQNVVLGGALSRLACGGLSLAFYFSKCFLPVNLMTIYPQWKVDPPSPVQFLPWLVLGGVLYFLWTKRATWGRHALLGLGFFVINLLPFLGFNAGSYMVHTWVMDHLLYIPILGLIGLAIAGWEQIEAQLTEVPRRIGQVVVTLLLALMAWSSWHYAALYFSLEALWSSNVALNPTAALPHNDLGIAYVRSGREAEGMQQFRISTELKPDYADAQRNFGISLLVDGQFEAAAKTFATLVQLTPRYSEAHYQYALALEKVGRAAESNDQYRKAIALDPQYMKAYNNLGANLAEQGRLPEAIAVMESALKVNPSAQQIQENLGKMYEMQKASAIKPKAPSR